MSVVAAFDWRSPDYDSVWAARIARLRRMRAEPGAVPAMGTFYRDHPAAFIDDWGVTFDPRNVERELPALAPFVLWPKQVELVDWIVARWKAGEPGIVEKSRDSGATWISVALACTLCLFNRGLVIGFGSRKLDYIDQLGAPKSIFEKARTFLSHLPAEFLGGWRRDEHAPFGRIMFPATGSVITGEGGDGIGRGDRTGLYVLDEAAFLEHPELVDASLSATTNCRIDISTPNGMGNPFARRRHSGRVKVFTLSWRDDPRKDQAWFDRQVATLDPATVAREIGLDYLGSVENQLLPAAWIQASIDAHRNLGIKPTGSRYAALDVADQGGDLNCFAGRHGILLQCLQSWSGQGSDLFKSTARAMSLAEHHGYEAFFYDSVGVGSAVRGDAEIINGERTKEGKGTVNAVPFNAAGAVDDPEGMLVPERRNKDFFANLKAQSWWALRMRFAATHAALQGRAYIADDIISIDGSLPELTQLLSELSQIQFSVSTVGKIVIDKAPDGAASPNRADAVMIAFNPTIRSMEVWRQLALD